MEILRMHRHAADEENGTTQAVDRERHHGAEREARKFTRMRGETAEVCDRSECTGALGE
jgi:hypothetical protein